MPITTSEPNTIHIATMMLWCLACLEYLFLEEKSLFIFDRYTGLQNASPYPCKDMKSKSIFLSKMSNFLMQTALTVRFQLSFATHAR